jgi:hypothetical protein
VGEQKDPAWEAKELLIWPDLKELRVLLAGVLGERPGCSCEQQGLLEGVAGDLEPAQGNLVVEDLIDAASRLKSNSSGKRYQTHDKDGVSVAGKRLDESAARKVIEELAPSQEEANDRGFELLSADGGVPLYRKTMEGLQSICEQRPGELALLAEEERCAVEALLQSQESPPVVGQLEEVGWGTAGLESVREADRSEERAGLQRIAELESTVGDLQTSLEASKGEIAELKETVRLLQDMRDCDNMLAAIDRARALAD